VGAGGGVGASPAHWIEPFSVLLLYRAMVCPWELLKCRIHSPEWIGSNGYMMAVGIQVPEVVVYSVSRSAS
jgi:hypothetical protein